MLLGSGQLFASQAAISGILVATLPPGSSPSFGRFFDSLAGGIIAIAVSALVLPPKPLVMLRRSVGPLLDELAATLEDVADALEARDRAAAEAALVRARGIDELEARFEEAVHEGRETARLRAAAPAPARPGGDLRDRRGPGRPRRAQRARAGPRRGPGAAARRERPAGAERGAARPRDRRASAGGRARGRDADPRPCASTALRAAARATRVLEGTGNLSVSVLVGQVRSTAVDLLRGTGLSYDEASQAVRRAAQEAKEADAAAQP